MIRLFTLMVRHGFYNDAGDACDDLLVAPTPDAAAAMQRLGVVFRCFGADSVIALDAERLPGLRDWIAREGAALAFTLTPRTPDFLGVTDLPLDMLPTGRKLRLSNVATAMPGGDVVRLGGADGATATMLRPSDEVPTPSAPHAIGLVELLLTQPAPGVGDPLSFPVGGDGTVKPVALELRFAARATQWRYYVTAERGTLGDDLSIAGTGASFRRTAARLPGGAAAALFTADVPLPLRRRSPFRFRLTGECRDEDGGRAPIEVSRLPVAAPSPVCPADPGNPNAAASDIYVTV